MIILDTNVLSALMLQVPDQAVVSWLDRQPRTSIWITSITVLEVRYGLQILATGKRRTSLTEAFEKVLSSLGQRVLTFDVSGRGSGKRVDGVAAQERCAREISAIL